MNKNIKILFISFSLILWTPDLFAQAGGADGATLMLVGDAAAATAGTAYAQKNASRCGRRRFSACVRAVLGVMQVAQIVSNFFKSNDTRMDLSASDIAQIPSLDGLCLDASSCTQDSLDLEISNSPVGDALRSGDLNSLIAATKAIQGDLTGIESDLADKGYTFDQEAGTLTGPDGNTQSLSQLASDPANSLLPSDVQSQLSAKLGSILGSGSNSSNGSKTASGGAGSFKILDEIIIDEDLNAKKRGLASLKKKTNEDFLAAMADKAGNGSVGVAGDDIFKMIQRRYNKKKKTEEFIFR